MNFTQHITQLKELVDSLNVLLQTNQTKNSKNSTQFNSSLNEHINKLTILYNSFSHSFNSNNSNNSNKENKLNIHIGNLHTIQKDIRKEANKIWNLVVKNSQQIDISIQISLRYLSCLFLQLQPLEIDFNLIKMLAKTARLIDESNNSFNSLSNNSFHSSINTSIKTTSKELFDQSNALLQSTEKRITTEQSKREFIVTSKIVYLHQLLSSWENGEIDQSWVFYNKLKSNLTALNHLGKEHCEEIQCIVYNHSKELFEKEIYQESVNWMKEYLYLLHLNASNNMNNSNQKQIEEERKYTMKLQQEGFDIISTCYFSLKNYEESLKWCDKSIEIERNETNELLQIKCLFLLSFNQETKDLKETKEKKEIERTIKNYILNTSNPLSSKIELVQFLHENLMKEMNNFNQINQSNENVFKELLIFCFEQLLSSITSQQQIDTNAFYSLFTNYLSFLFSSSTTNIVLVQNALSLLINVIRKGNETKLNLNNNSNNPTDKNALRKIIVLLWERGIADCIAKNERIGKEWFYRVEELLSLTQLCGEQTEMNGKCEISEIKKNIALCEYSLGNLKEAICKSKEAISLGCSQMEAEFVLFASLVKLGKKEEAIQEMINAVNGSVNINHIDENKMEIETNDNENKFNQNKMIEENDRQNEIIQKEITPQEKIEYIESCCYLCEELKEKELSIIALKQLLQHLSQLITFVKHLNQTKKNEIKIDQYEGLGMIILRELMTKSNSNELEILQLFLSQFDDILSLLKTFELFQTNENQNQLKMKEDLFILIGNDKGEIEWNLASLYNLSKRSYCEKEYEKCFLSTILYHLIIITQHEYHQLHENNILIALLGLASKIELLLTEKQSNQHMNQNNQSNENNNNNFHWKEIIKFLQMIVTFHLQQIRQSQHMKHIQNEYSKLEITSLLLEIKYAMVIDDFSSVSQLTQKLLSKEVNASILELIGMSLLSFQYQNDGIICLKMAVSQICKNAEIDGIRLSRLIREIVCRLDNEMMQWKSLVKQ